MLANQKTVPAMFSKSEIETKFSGLTESSRSLCGEQVFIVHSKRHNRRVDCVSRTLNRSIHLNTYILPCAEELMEKISRYEMCSMSGSKRPYHQIPIKVSEKHYTAIETRKIVLVFYSIGRNRRSGMSMHCS